MAWWLSWLERRPVTAEVVGSNPIRVVLYAQGRIVEIAADTARAPRGEQVIFPCSIVWDLSSAGRASALQAEGHRFEPYRSH